VTGGREDRETGGRGELSVVHCSLLILALALLWPVMVRPGWWLWKPGAPHSDLAVTHWPNAHFTRRALWEEGRFPLWRPTIMSGAPFAANPLAGLYYPPNWLFLFLPWLPLELGFNLSALAHLWLAGGAMYALMRRGFGTGMWAALVAAVVYEASPKLMAHLGAGHVGWMQAWGWMPVVVLCGMKLLREVEEGGGKETGRKRFAIRDLRSATYMGVALAMQFCADVRMAAYTAAAVVALVVVTMAVTSRQAAVRLFAYSLTCSSAVFLGLTACQWLPAVSLLPETTRASMTLRDAAVWSLPWRYLTGLLLADHGGFHEWMTYVGVSTLVLAGFGVRALWREERRLAGWLVGLLVGAAWFSLGENGGLFQALYRVVPGLGLLRVPPRAWVLVVFAMAVLAGLGVEETRIHGGRETRRRGRGMRDWWRVAGLAVGAFPPLLVVGYWMLVGVPPLNLVMFGTVTPLAVALVSFRFRIGVNLKLIILKPETAFGLAAVLLVAADLLVVNVTLVGARSPEEVFTEGREAAEWLAAQPDRFRVYSPGYSVPQHAAELYGLELADGVDPLQLRVYADYLTRAAGLEPYRYSVTLPPFPEEADDIRASLEGVTPDVEMLGRLGVRYVAASFPMRHPRLLECGVMGGVYVYRNQAAQPVVDVECAIELSDGTVLFRYDPGAVYAGWVVSGVTVVGLLVGLSMSWRRGRCADD